MDSSNEVFSTEEKEILSSYVTNTDRSIFALTNLPEVIKGALFSRYSRSTLGLRSLLLRDFIQDKDSKFSEIQAGAENPDSAENSKLAIESAQKFYDRILDGYGDDSIGELGGAHLALENISILATKTVQDSRIGGSPLEKSTRYVSFADKIRIASGKEEFRFYQEPTLLNSEHRICICRLAGICLKHMSVLLNQYVSMSGNSYLVIRKSVKLRTNVRWLHVLMTLSGDSYLRQL